MLGMVLRSLGGLFFPRCCHVCGKALSDGERYMCIGCMSGLSRLEISGGCVQEVSDLFVGCKWVDSAVSFFRYNRQSKYSELIKDIKYRNCPVSRGGFFDGVDMIVPVPLHKSKLRRRGYNQSLFIAEGVSDVAGIKVVEALAAVRPHASQTSKSSEERRRNVAEVFEVVEDVAGKTVLLVDDVITTGATATVCCDVLGAAGVGRVKVLSLAFASTV